jgi:dephospho-CoA kinase
MAFENAIALTGGIAVGKSSTIAILSLYGFRCIDADKVAHQTLEEQKENIASMFGDDIITNGKVDRKKLGMIVFHDKSKLDKLEALLHPLIYNKIAELSEIEEKRGFPYLIDIPLFFEKKSYNIANSLVVYTPKDEQIKRLMKRDGFDFDEAEVRVNSQLDIETKKSLASYVIDNSGNLKQLQIECERARTQILEDFERQS